MSGSLGFGAGDVASLGVRLVAIDRPGLGRSDPDPEKTFATWADDVAELVREANLRAPLAVGFSQGAPFALALAARGVVGGVAIVSGQDELSHPTIRPLLHPDVAGMVEEVERDADGFERRFADLATAEVLLRLILEMSGERDRGVYGDASFAPALENTLREGFAQGARGYARDLVLALGRWPFEVEAIDVPVDLWYGGLDTSPVHSPDFGATLAARLRHATRVVDPDEGGSILWTRSQDILERLLHRARGA
jgi:pimeloyl-ACP methyl ester carboxylesterase